MWGPGAETPPDQGPTQSPVPPTDRQSRPRRLRMGHSGDPARHRASGSTAGPATNARARLQAPTGPPPWLARGRRVAPLPHSRRDDVGRQRAPPPAPQKPGGIPGCLKLLIVWPWCSRSSASCSSCSSAACQRPDRGPRHQRRRHDRRRLLVPARTATPGPSSAGSADAIELSGFYDATIGIIIDKRVLPTAPDCYVDGGAERRTWPGSPSPGRRRLRTSLPRNDRTRSRSAEDQGGGVTREWRATTAVPCRASATRRSARVSPTRSWPGWSCAGRPRSLRLGRPVAGGRQSVPDMRTPNAGVVISPAMCGVAQEVARAVLD